MKQKSPLKISLNRLNTKNLYKITLFISTLNLIILCTTGFLFALEKEEETFGIVSESNASKKIVLEKGGFMKSPMFIYGDEDPKKLATGAFGGLNPEFTEILRVHPSAYREAKRSIPYQLIGGVGFWSMIGMTVKLFADTLKQTDDPMESEDKFTWGDVTMTGVAAGVFLFSSMIANSHIKNSINIFNSKQEKIDSLRSSNKNPFEFKLSVTDRDVKANCLQDRLAVNGVFTYRF